MNKSDAIPKTAIKSTQIFGELNSVSLLNEMKFEMFLCVTLIQTAIICVVSCLNTQSRIRNGSPSQLGQFPFFAHLEMMEKNNPNTTVCGGTLLNELFILTAAHCMFNKSKITIRLGTLQIHRALEMGRKTVTVHSNFFYIHPEYDPDTLMNDIGLIRLREPLTFSHVIQPISFPSVCDIHEGLKLIAIGNGRCGTHHQIPPIVQYTTLQTIPFEECTKIFNDIDKTKTFCAMGLRNEAITDGDSGGPVVHPTQNTLYGISSFGNEFDSDELPQGFINVFAYTHWISRITKIPIPCCNQNAERIK